MSKQQKLLLTKLKSVLGRKVSFIENYRPNFMRNPKTGFNTEIDIFIKEVKVGIEYQGFHHFLSGKNADSTRHKDNMKRQWAKRGNAFIVEIFEQNLLKDKRPFNEMFLECCKIQLPNKKYEQMAKLIKDEKNREMNKRIARQNKRRIYYQAANYFLENDFVEDEYYRAMYH